MLNIVCVLKTGDNGRGVYYSGDWVDRLYRGICRNLDIKFNFVCLSDIATNYTTIPLITDSLGYWNKVELFRPDLFDGPVLYLDIDTVICKNITETILKLPNDRFLMVREPYKNIHNSSVMYWNGNYNYLFEKYKNYRDEIVQEYQFNLSRQGCLGDQAYIGENIDHGLIEDYAEPGFIGWCHHKIDYDIGDPSILIFTGQQKPSNNLQLDLVQKNWI